MIEEKLTIGLVVERRMLDSAWGGCAWRPVAIFLTLPEAAPWTPLGTAAKTMRYYAGAHDVMLYSSETAGYSDNLASASPKLWVVMRPEGPEPPIDIVAVTLDPAEGEAHTETGANTVETITMPAEMANLLAAFVRQHHVERPMLKRQRNRWHKGDGGGGPGGPRGSDGSGGDPA